MAKPTEARKFILPIDTDILTRQFCFSEAILPVQEEEGEGEPVAEAADKPVE